MSANLIGRNVKIDGLKKRRVFHQQETYVFLPLSVHLNKCLKILKTKVISPMLHTILQ